MRLRFFAVAGFCAAAAAAFAQAPSPMNLDILSPGATIDAANPDLTNNGVEADGVAVIPNASAWYLFDSVGAFDGILKGTPALSTFATEAQIAGGSASAGDLDADANNLYISTFDGTKQRIWRVPHTTGFGGAAEMIDSSLGAAGPTFNIKEIEVDAKNSRLIVSKNDAFGAVVEDMAFLPLTQTNGSSTTLVTESQMEAVLATITGYGDDTQDDINVHDFTVQSDGDIIISHGFVASAPSRRVGGSLLRITESGAISVFRTADQIITAAGGTPGTHFITQVNVEALSDNKILIHVQVTNNVAFPPFIAVVSADGTSQITLATQTQLAADPDVTTTLVPSGQVLFRMDGKGGDVAANDDYYFYRQGASQTPADVGGNAVLRLSGVRAFLNANPLSAVQDWSVYN